MTTSVTTNLREIAREKLHGSITDMLKQEHKPNYVEWYVTTGGEVITEEFTDQNSWLDNDNISAIIKLGCGLVACDCDWCCGEGAVESVDDIEFDSDDFSNMESRIDEALDEVSAGFFDDETFICGGCGEEVSANFNSDDAGYEGATGCGTCGKKFCVDCADDLVYINTPYDASSSICIHCHPQAFIKAITIATGDKVRLVGENAPLYDENDEETSYFSDFLSHYETVLQDKFKYADIRFDSDSSRDMFIPSIDAEFDVFCDIEERINRCWEKAIETFKV